MTTATLESITVTRYFCGCIYETAVDLTLICPVHRSTPHKAFMTTTETLPVSRNKAVSNVRGLVHAAYSKNQPMRLESEPSNSVHVLTTITDPNHNEWAQPEAELVGLCPACFIDDHLLTETHVSICECGNSCCPYRWCGSIRGLHALWRMHIHQESQKLIGYPEEDIFSHGSHDQQPENIRRTLDHERGNMELAITQTAIEFVKARSMATPWAGRRRYYQAVYLAPWMDREYRHLVKGMSNKEKAWTRTNMRKKLIRLVLTGATAGTGSQDREGQEENLTPTPSS